MVSEKGGMDEAGDTLFALLRLGFYGFNRRSRPLVLIAVGVHWSKSALG